MTSKQMDSQFSLWCGAKWKIN